MRNGKVPLEVLLRVGVGLVGVVEGDLELVDVSLELLLETKQFGLALGLGLERCLDEGVIWFLFQLEFLQ